MLAPLTAATAGVLSAGNLYQPFADNALSAEAEYGGREITVRGGVSEVGRDLFTDRAHTGIPGSEA